MMCTDRLVHCLACVTALTLFASLSTAYAEMTDLGTFGGSRSEALDINDAGQVVGTYWTETGEYHAFL